MFDLISIILTLGSLSVITFLILRKLLVLEDKKSFSQEKESFLKEEKFLGKALEEWDEISKNFLEFFLRKIKIVSLKVDNKISFWLESIKKEEKKENSFSFEKLNHQKKIQKIKIKSQRSSIGRATAL